MALAEDRQPDIRTDLSDVGETNLQYANWKRSIEPFAHYIPVYAGIGNHEAITHKFKYEKTGVTYSVDKFPFDTESAEAVFASNFVNPLNGPDSEDGASYDPDPNSIDFPSYKVHRFIQHFLKILILTF